jgi:hypothetical protein
MLAIMNLGPQFPTLSRKFDRLGASPESYRAALGPMIGSGEAYKNNRGDA